MKFTDVVNALIAGKRVRRAVWHRVGSYITCDFEQMTMYVGGVVSAFSPNKVSLIADDWEVLDD
jgi:hypothetical protein